MRSPFNEFHCGLGLFPNISKFPICHKHERERGNDSVRNEDTVKERKKEKLGSQYEDLRLFFVYVAGSMELYGLDSMIKCWEMD